ncbi:MAG: phosphatidate cytidylyltransferase [Actinomycetota bacterium]
MKLAVATGLMLAGAVIGLLFAGPKAFFPLAFVVILVAQAEFYAAARKAGHDPATALGVMSGALLLVGVFTKGASAAGLVVFLTLVFSIVWYMTIERRDGLLTDIALTLFGIVYIPLLGSFAVLLSRACVGPGECPPNGGGLALVMIGAAAFYDIFAFAGGYKFGKTPLAPSISPKKTREGALVATVCTLVLATLVAPLLGPWSPVQALVLGALVCIAAPMGDLVESMIKRDLGLKDIGVIFPGHGGALDRIDAVLFTGPAVYISLLIAGYIQP